MDVLLDRPDALVLYQFLVRWHANRPHFAIAPRAMSETGSLPWSRQRIARARDHLLACGFIEEVRCPARRLSGLYRLCPFWPVVGNNHYTPSPPLNGQERTEGRADH